MSSFVRFCALAVMLSPSLLACDVQPPDPDLTELRADAAECTSVASTLRELEDPNDLLFIEDLMLNVVVDPKTAPLDISTGVIEGNATIYAEGRFGSPMKIKLKVVVLPAGPSAE